MSHFVVMVVGDDYQELLAPYQENNMRDFPSEYLEWEDKEEEYRDAWENDKVLAFKTGDNYKFRYQVDVDEDELEEISLKEMYDDFDEFAEDYYGNMHDGKYGYYYNPNAKWDWYQLGGRWQGELLVPEDTEFYRTGDSGVFGGPEYDYTPEGHIRVDQALSGDIAWDKMPNFSVYAILDDQGWHAKGEMGWFGVSTDEVEDWAAVVTEYINNLDDEEKVSIIDCHI